MKMQKSRPRPRLEGGSNPAFTGVDVRSDPSSPGNQAGSVIPSKLASGADKARVDSIKSARSVAAKRMMNRGEE